MGKLLAVETWFGRNFDQFTDWFGRQMFAVGTAFVHFVYFLWKILANIADFLELMFRRLAGLDGGPYSLGKETVQVSGVKAAPLQRTIQKYALLYIRRVFCAFAKVAQTCFCIRKPSVSSLHSAFS